MVIGESGRGLLSLTIIVCILLISGKLEGPRDRKLGILGIRFTLYKHYLTVITSNDQMYLQAFLIN